MPKHSIQACQDIYNCLKSNVQDKPVPPPILQRAIKLTACTEPRTLRKYGHLLLEFEFIKQQNDQFIINRDCLYAN